MTIHTRKSWLGTDTMSAPAPTGREDTWVIHWPGGHVGRPKSKAECEAILRAMNNDYRNNRGYYLGYNYVVFPGPYAFEVRGSKYRNAANAGKKVSGNFNERSRSIQMYVPIGQQADQSMIDLANEIIRRDSGWDIGCHIDYDYTSCCGDVIPQVRAGLFNGKSGPVVPPPSGVQMPDGYDPVDSWWLFPLDDSKPAIRAYDRNVHVRYLQDVIFFYAGGDIPRTGIFDGRTVGRVKDLQRLFEFPSAYVDGIVGNGRNGDGKYATWDIVDMLISLNRPPAPPPPPKVEVGVTSVSKVQYLVQPGDSPWSVGRDLFGNGKKGADIFKPRQFSLFSTPGNLHRIPVPMAGKKIVVRPDEGAMAILRRIGASTSEQNLERFYRLNGGWEWVHHPGDVVYFSSNVDV